MKKIKLALTCILIALMFTVLAACNSSTDVPSDEQNPSAEASSSQQDTESSDNISGDLNNLSIFSDGKYNCNIICSEAATDIEKDLYNKIRDKLKSITGVLPKYCTDFRPYNDSGEERAKPAILVGYTNYDESSAVYNTLRCGECKIKVEGNKLVIAVASLQDATNAYVQFMSLLRNQTAENLSIPLDVDMSKVSDKFLSRIPTYPYGRLQISNCGNDSYLIYANDASKSDAEAYKDKAIDTGFTLRSERTVADNVFYTLVNEQDYLYIYYKPNEKTVRAIAGPLNSLAADDYSMDTGLVAEPSLTLVGQPEGSDIGQGYIFVLPDGRLIIQDGGIKSSKKADNVYKSVMAIAPDPENVIIAAWFISHPHGDHQYAIEYFIENHGSDDNITIQNFVLNYAPSSMYDYKREDGGKENSGSHVTKIFNIISKHVPEANIVKPHTGQLLDFGNGASVEILYTPEDYLPAELFDYVNSTSLVIRVVVEGTSVLLLADTTHVSGRIMENAFGSYLKSDMVQLAHHGQFPSNSSLYKAVAAKVLLWPANYASGKALIKQHGGVINTALSYASDVYVSDSNLTTLPLPYVIINNKDNELNKFN